MSWYSIPYKAYTKREDQEHKPDPEEDGDTIKAPNNNGWGHQKGKNQNIVSPLMEEGEGEGEE